MHPFSNAKAMAKAMRKALAERGTIVSHGEALEIVAAQFGLASWNILASKLDENHVKESFSFEPAVPMLRIFDVAKAHEFYLDFLGFGVDWEHRFGDNFPLYTQVSRGALRLHLTEHVGDANPGANMVVYMDGVRAWQAELAAKNYRYMKPGLAEQDWGLEMGVTDPFGNRIRFMEVKARTPG